MFFFFQIFLTIAIKILDPVIPLYLTNIFGLNKTTVGFFFSIGFGVASLLAQIPAGILADKYGRWLSSCNGDCLNIFIDYETFGEHQWEETCIFDFIKASLKKKPSR